MALITLPFLFYDPSLKARIPTDIKFDDHTIMYLLINPRRFKIFDYDKFIRNLYAKACLQDNFILQYSCEGSDFKDKYHQHTVTGDLQIMKIIICGRYPLQALNTEIIMSSSLLQ